MNKLVRPLKPRGQAALKDGGVHVSISETGISEEVLIINTVKIGLRISDTLRYSGGEWDKIPYSCDIELNVGVKTGDISLPEKMTLISAAVETVKAAIKREMMSYIEDTRENIRSAYSLEKFNG